MDKWTPDAEGKGFAFTEILAPLEKYRDRITIVSNLAHPGRGRSGFRRRRRPCTLGRRVPERRASGERFDPRGNDHRSDRRAADRPGYAAAVPRTFDRRSGVELRVGLRLRVLQHDFLEDADHAAADGEQSAGGVRETVRRRKHQRRPDRAKAAEPQPARFRDGPGRVVAEGPARAGPQQAQRIPGRRARDRAAHSKAAAACLGRPEAAGSAGGRAGILRRTLQDHVRPAGAGLQAGDHAHRHYDVRARH